MRTVIRFFFFFLLEKGFQQGRSRQSWGRDGMMTKKRVDCYRFGSKGTVQMHQDSKRLLLGRENFCDQDFV